MNHVHEAPSAVQLTPTSDAHQQQLHKNSNPKSNLKDDATMTIPKEIDKNLT
jgi:hypothetical protein